METVMVNAGLGNLRGHTDQYRSALVDALCDAGAEVLATGDTRGEWNGVPEAGWHWLALVRPDELIGLRESLADVAARFGQDAIGFLVHDHISHPNSYVEARHSELAAAG